MTVFFAMQKLFSCMMSDLSQCLCKTILFRSLSLCQWAQGYSTLFLLSDSVYLVFCWYLWSIWSWVLYRTITVDLFRFFYIQLCSLSRTIYWRCCCFSQHVSLAFWKRIRCPYVCGLLSGLSIQFYWSIFFITTAESYNLK